MSGKWSEPGVPHKGWICVTVEDLGAPGEICQMCEVREIRYVHLMQHPDFGEEIRAGCVCAGKMEGNYVAARERERRLRNEDSRRQRWLRRKWKISQRGNPFLKIDDFNITIFRRGESWSGLIKNTATGKQRFARQSYPSADAAKRAAFDALKVIKDKDLLR